MEQLVWIMAIIFWMAVGMAIGMACMACVLLPRKGKHAKGWRRKR